MNQPAVPGCPTFAERIIVGASGEIRKQRPAPGHKAGNPRGQVGRIRRRGDTGTGMRVGERLCAVADVPVGVIGLFQRLHHRGQRLPGDAHCLGRLPAVDQPADHGDYLVDLAGVCMGARVLDVAVPGYAPDLELRTATEPHGKHCKAYGLDRCQPGSGEQTEPTWLALSKIPALS